MFITGDNDYYSKFGFEAVSKIRHTYGRSSLEDEAPFFMVKTIKRRCIKRSYWGYYIFDECYNVDNKELKEFDQKFPFKKKEVREGQLGF